jgi:hypothetical protein
MKLGYGNALPASPQILLTRRVRALTSEMMRLRSLLSEKFESEAGDLVIKINDLLVKFAAAPNNADRDQLGCDIYNDLVDFSGNIGKELDSNIFG